MTDGPLNGKHGIEHLLASWEGEHAVCRHDRATGAWFFICVHSTALGVGAGGTRMRPYASASDALADAMRLSGAMTRKLALADLPYGGAKGVIAVPELPSAPQRRELLVRYARTVASMRGAFWTSGDLNVSTPDLKVMSAHCPYLFGTGGASGDRLGAAAGTALGTLEGIRVSLRHATGDDGLKGRTVLVQGIGDVGGVLAEVLAQERAHVLVSDLRGDRVDAVAAATGATRVDPASALETECDVLAPCAVGGLIDRASVSRLRCAIVAGSANNPLVGDGTAEALRDSGILYAPDFVISAGGVLEAIGTESLGWSPTEVRGRLRRIGATLDEVFRIAQEHGVSTEDAALALVERRLAAGR